jgi:hypothetical protein
MARGKVGLAALAVLGYLGPLAQAQEPFPGGWASEIGVERFSVPAYSGTPFGFRSGHSRSVGGPMAAFGMPEPGRFDPWGGFGSPGPDFFRSAPVPIQRAARSPSRRPRIASMGSSGQTVNTLNPLTHSIRHATKRRRSR